MYKPLQGGSKIRIGSEDLSIEVNLPPVGFVWNHHDMKLERTEIIARSSIKAEQYWERPKQPDHYYRKAAREKELQRSNPDHYDPELRTYRLREWHRRLYGVWYMNNGVPTYLTGPYYFYLAHWNLDVGPPVFKIADLHKAYFWEYCQQDPFCYGMLEMTKRRVGKTYFATCMIYEYASRTKNSRFGIQSKNREDAKGVFDEKLIQPWRQLLDIFRPVYDASQGDIPKSALRFFRTAKKGANIENVFNDAEELSTWIDYKSSETHAYDGQKLKRYLCDEVFKTVEVDIIKRHSVLRPCLENENGEIIGKAIYTSTVEDMEGYLDLYIKLWKESDFYKRNANGKTISGLYRWFTPAQHIMYVNKYGVPDEERALKEIENEIRGKEDPRDQADYKRKFPRNWKEAFNSGSDNCLFNPIKLDDRLSTLHFKKESELYKRYSLEWDKDIKEGDLPRVKLVEKPNGRFRFCWNFADPSRANDVIRRGSAFLPKNNLRFVIGIDPFDHNRTKDGKFSQGAAAVFMKYDPMDIDGSDKFVAYYVGRPNTSAVFYEEMLMLCHYFSCQMLFEDQKPKIHDHFVDRGYGHFLVRDSKGIAGISASPKTHQALAEHIDTHIEDNCHREMFPDMLTDWKDLDLDNTTQYDLAMASGYALIAASRILRKEKLVNKLTTANSKTLIKKYTIRKNGYRGKFSKSLR